jgi:hypothetical protein
MLPLVGNVKKRKIPRDIDRAGWLRADCQYSMGRTMRFFVTPSDALLYGHIGVILSYNW